MRPRRFDEVWIKRAVLAALPLELFLVGYVLNGSAPVASPFVLQARGVEISYGPGWTRRGTGDGLDHRDGSRLRIAAPGDERSPTAQLVELDGTPAEHDRSDIGAQRFVFTRADGRRIAISCKNATPVDVCGPVLATVTVEGAVDAAPSPEAIASIARGLADLRAAARSAAPRLDSRNLTRRAAALRRIADAYAALARTTTRLSREAGLETQRRGLGRVAAASRRAATTMRALVAATQREARAAHRRLRPRARRVEAQLRAAVAALGKHGYGADRGRRS